MTYFQKYAETSYVTPEVSPKLPRHNFRHSSSLTNQIIMHQNENLTSSIKNFIHSSEFFIHCIQCSIFIIYSNDAISPVPEFFSIQIEIFSNEHFVITNTTVFHQGFTTEISCHV